MTPELKAKWLEALRSGKYIQGKHALRTLENGFCCMGVACDLIDPQKWDSDVSPDGDGYNWGAIRTGYTDDALAVALGISKDMAAELAHLNDNCGKTFAQIADHIEAKL